MMDTKSERERRDEEGDSIKEYCEIRCFSEVRW